MRRRWIMDTALLAAVLATLVALAPPAHAEGDEVRDLDDIAGLDDTDGDLRDLGDEDAGYIEDARGREADGDRDDIPLGARGAGGRHGAVAAPPIGEVLAAAYRAAGLERGMERGLARRARLAGLIPWVSVRSGRTTSWRDDDPSVGRSSVIDVRATWRLDRLVFEPRELQAAAIATTRQRERRRLARLVIEVYFRWARAQALAARRPRAAGNAAAAQAELDALTNDAFSAALARARRTASGHRTPTTESQRP